MDAILEATARVLVDVGYERATKEMVRLVTRYIAA